MKVLERPGEVSSIVQQHIKESSTEAVDYRWNTLYKVGGVAALVAGLVFRRNLGSEFMLLRGAGIINTGPSSPPTTIMDWFTLLQNNKLLGLTLLNVFDNVNFALVGLMFLALFAALRKTSVSVMTIAVVIGFVGIGVYFASNQAFSMLSLSNQYTAAATDAQKTAFLAAGQAALAIHNSAGSEGPGLYLSFLLVSIAGLIISAVMLRSNIFSKKAAYTGILANVFGLGSCITVALAPSFVFLPASLSGLFWFIWYILIGIKLLQLGRGKRNRSANRIGITTGEISK